MNNRTQKLYREPIFIPKTLHRTNIHTKDFTQNQKKKLLLYGIYQLHRVKASEKSDIILNCFLSK